MAYWTSVQVKTVRVRGGRCSSSNTDILERFQSKALRMIVDLPWHVPNTIV
jgi:hypothetical protein